jgi:hypothetical protein
LAPNFFLVPPAGFEPTTFWFEARHSNPLSYGGTSRCDASFHCTETSFAIFAELQLMSTAPYEV